MYEKLRDQLFVDVDYPKELTDLIRTAQPWRDFCALPQDIKNKMQLTNNPLDTETGYKFRSRAEGREDKEYFHAYPNLLELAEEAGLASQLESTPALRDFFKYAVDIQGPINNFALEIGRKLGESIPELAELIDTGKLRSVLRFLHYTNDDVAEVIAAQHFDRSLYTLHLYESGPGLQFMNWDMQWRDAPIDIGNTVVFSGYRLEQLTKGEIQKTWHRVVRKDGVTDRISLVLFVWSEAVPSYPQEARSQDLEPSYTQKVDG